MKRKFRKIHHFCAIVVDFPRQNDTINMLSSCCPCTSAPAWAWGRQFKQNGGFNSMLNKLKRAALGAHTPHDKATAASKPIPMPLPAQVRILMSQHIGAPAKALVKKGDEVFVGTKIGEAGGFVSANIHSSVSGTVAAVEPFRLSNGRMCDSVVIKTDGKQTVDPAVKAPEVTASSPPCVRAVWWVWAAQAPRLTSSCSPRTPWIPCSSTPPSVKSG